MKISVLPTISLLVISMATLRAQSDGDYQSAVTTGNFGDVPSWETFSSGFWQPAVSTPTSSSGAITISTGDTISVAPNVAIDQTTIAATAALGINSGTTLTLANGVGTDLTVDGLFTNSGAFTVNGGATIAVSATGTYVNNSANAPNPAAFSFAAGSTFIVRGSSTVNAQGQVSGRTFSNVIFESSSGTWAATIPGGTGPWTVDGNLTVGGDSGTVHLSYGSYTGTSTFNGNVTVKAASQLGTSGSGARSFTIADQKALNVEDTASVNVASGQTVAIANGGSALLSGSNAVNGAGNFTLSSGASIVIGSSSGLDGAVSVSGTKSYSTGANYFFQNSGTMGVSLPDTVNDLGLGLTSGTIALSDGGTFLTVNRQYYQAGGTLVAGLTSHALVLNKATIDSLPAAILDAGASIDSGVAVQFIGTNSSALRRSAGATQTTIAGSVDLGGFVRTFDVASGATGDDLVLSGIVSNGGIIKTGEGTLHLTGNNDYADGTTVNAGKLAVSGLGTLGSTSGAVTVNGGILDLGGSTFTASTFSLNGGSVQNGSISTTSGTDFSHSGSSDANIGGSGGVTVASGTTVTLSGNNDYSGETQVSGNLVAGSTDALSGNSSYTLDSGSSLDLNGHDSSVGGLNGSGSVNAGSADLTIGSGNYSGTITSSGQIEKTGNDTLTLTSSSNSLGSALVSAGTLEVGATGATGGAPVRVVNNGKFKVGGGVSNTSNVTLDSSGATFDKVLSNGESVANSGSIISNLGGNSTPTTSLLPEGNVGPGGGEFTATSGSGDSSTVSDTLTLNGLDGNTFLLVMYADPSDLSDNSFLGWLDPSDSIWTYATLGNHEAPGLLAASYTDLTYESFLSDNGGWNALTMLGAYGVDPTSGEVWAVIDHNSEFGAIPEPVPEPSSWGLLTVGAGLALWRRYRRQVDANSRFTSISFPLSAPFQG